MKKTNGITLIALVITIIVLLILAGVSISAITGENGIVTKAREAKEKTEDAEEQEKETLDALDKYISDKVSNSGEEHGIYFNQPYNAMFDFNGDGAVEFLTLVVYEDGNMELFVNQIFEDIEPILENLEADIILSSDGKIISVSNSEVSVDFKLNTEKHDLYFGERYNVAYAEDERLIEYILYEDGSGEIFEDFTISQTLPAGSCVYDEGNITIGTDEAYVSMDGTQVIIPGNVIISKNTIQLDRTYMAYVSIDIDTSTRTLVFHKDGSLTMYINGILADEGTFEFEYGNYEVYEGAYANVLVKLEDDWEVPLVVLQGGMTLAELGWGTKYYGLYEEAAVVSGILHSMDEIEENKYLNNGELTLPEYWIGDDGIKYLTHEILFGTSRRDIKSIVIPNGAYVTDIYSYAEEFKVNADNERYSVVDGVLYNKDITELVAYPGGKEDTTFEIPDDVTSLGRGNGYRADINSYVTTLIVPRSLTDISAINTIFPSLTTINYEGTEEEWANISWESNYDFDIEINFEYTP